MAEYTVLNKHLQKVTTFGNKTVICLPTKNEVLRTRTTYISPGLYKVQITKIAVNGKKDDKGVAVVETHFVVVAPDSQKNATLRKYFGTPRGKTEEEARKAGRFLAHMAISCASDKGPEAVAAVTKDDFSVKGGWEEQFKGKFCYVRVQNGPEYKGRPQSEIGGFVTKEQFEVSPGPSPEGDDGGGSSRGGGDDGSGSGNDDGGTDAGEADAAEGGDEGGEGGADLPF